MLLHLIFAVSVAVRMLHAFTIAVASDMLSVIFAVDVCVLAAVPEAA